MKVCAVRGCPKESCSEWDPFCLEHFMQWRTSWECLRATQHGDLPRFRTMLADFARRAWLEEKAARP